jgi:putative oxidoreductase
MSWESIIGTEQDYVIFILRLALGIVLFAHGMGKLLGWFGGHGVKGTVAGMGALGVPKFAALLVVLGEGFGSIAMILGLFGRITAIGILIIMMGAMIKNLPNGWFMNWYGKKDQEGVEYFVLLLAIVMAIIVRGSGALSIDYYWFSK